MTFATRPMAALAAVVLALTSACSALGETASTPGSTAASAPSNPSTSTDVLPQDAPATTSPTPDTAPPTSGGPASPAAPDPQPVAVRSATLDGIGFSLGLLPLAREGQTVVLTARLQATSVPATLGTSQGRGVLSPTTSTTDPNFDVDSGFSLVDRARGVVHLPARDGERDLCTATHTEQWHRGDLVWVSCIFAGVPASATKLTVQAHTFGAFSDVPLR